MTKAVGDDESMLKSLQEVEQLFEMAQTSVFKLMSSVSSPVCTRDYLLPITDIRNRTPFPSSFVIPSMPVCSRNTISTLASQDRTRLPSLQFRNAPQAVLRGDALNLGTQPHSIFDGWLTRELWAGAISVHTARTPHWEWQAPVLTPWYDTIIYASDVFSNTIFYFPHLTRDRAVFSGRHDIFPYILFIWIKSSRHMKSAYDLWIMW